MFFLGGFGIAEYCEQAFRQRFLGEVGSQESAPVAGLARGERTIRLPFDGGTGVRRLEAHGSAGTRQGFK